MAEVIFSNNNNNYNDRKILTYFIRGIRKNRAIEHCTLDVVNCTTPILHKRSP